MAAKFCVFCGEKPNDKTKEHVIPQWLMRMTGDPNRKVNLGIDTAHIRNKNELKYREFSFSSFQFPACDLCNGEFSDLETKTKVIVDKIFAKDLLTNWEINTLLNWFDKVRVGLWLGALLLDREMGPDPKFFIKNRMAEKDRALFIYELNDDWQGLQFVGFNTPGFLFSPSCFSLCINNLVFFNISSDYLIARNIGFPFPEKQNLREDGLTEFQFKKGLEKFKMPILKEHFHKASIEIYQPIIIKNIRESIEKDPQFNSKYIKENSLDFKLGLGDIFYYDNGELLKVDNETAICLTDDSTKIDRVKFNDINVKQVFEMQLKLIKMGSTLDLTLESRRNIKNTYKSIIDMQSLFIKAYLDSLKREKAEEEKKISEIKSKLKKLIYPR